MEIDRPRTSAAWATVKPREDAELDDLGLDRFDLGQPLQGLVEGQQVLVNPGYGRLYLVEVNPGTVTAALESVVTAGVLDQDSTHGLGRRGEEMATAVPWPIGSLADQPQVRLMHQRRRLQRLPRSLSRQPLRSQPPQLVVDQRQ